MTGHRRAISAGLALAVAAGGLAALVPAAPAAADPVDQITVEQVSLGPTGVHGDGVDDSSFVSGGVVSEDGRFVVFPSRTPLLPADANGRGDAYLRDRLTGELSIVAVTTTEQPLSLGAKPCGISDDGNRVAFSSESPELGGVAGRRHVYLRDRAAGTTTRMSVSSSEVAANGGSGACTLSGDGSTVAFTSDATNLVVLDTNGERDVFVRNVVAGTTGRVNLGPGSTEANGASSSTSLSDDGNLVVFASDATNLVGGDANGRADVFVRNRSAGTTTLVSRATGAGGTQANDDAGSGVIAGDGGFVAFRSHASNLVAGDTNATSDIFVRNLATSTTELASVIGLSTKMDGYSERPAISDDGRYVAFGSTSSNTGTGSFRQVYLRDRTTGVGQLASRRWEGNPANGEADYPAISGNGRVLMFNSEASDMVRGDTDTERDVYVRDLAMNYDPFGGSPSMLVQEVAARQQLEDFVGGNPSPAVVAEQKAILQHGEENPDRMIDRFAHEPAWAQHRAPVARLYWAFFLRLPDTGGLAYWVGKRQGGKTLSSTATQFAKSSEFQNTYGSLTNAAFVTKIYQNIFDREPDPSGQTYWTNQLNTGRKTRGQVMVSFSESSEGIRYLAAPVDTTLVLLGMRGGSMPNPSQGTFWITGLRAGTPIESLIKTERMSPHYALRGDPTP